MNNSTFLPENIVITYTYEDGACRTLEQMYQLAELEISKN